MMSSKVGESVDARENASKSGPDLSSRDRGLEQALLFNFIIHAVAMLAMAALLIPTLPGGSGASDSERIAAIAKHPWLFRLGWLPWQLCAVADLWLAIAMVRVPWLPRVAAILVLLLTIGAVIPDQWAQGLWVTRGVTLAEAAFAGGDPGAYLALEKEIFPLTAGWGALLYTSAALGWTYCFARGGTWSRALTIASGPLWLTMFVAVLAPLLPEAQRPSPSFVSVANALGFLQLQVWLALVTEKVLERARPIEPHGRLAPWRYPARGLLARMLDVFANSRLFGVLLEPLPEVEMRSDITDVIYVNYLVPASRLLPFVPPNLELERVGPPGDAEKKYALFSFLTYRHGHFGFAFLGSLRRFMPSPIQTNWRIHVRDPRTGHRGIYFITNAITHLIPALGARMLTEGMPMHVLADASVLVDSSTGKIELTLDPGEGSAPDASITLNQNPKIKAHVLEGPWAECWRDFRDFLAYCVPQDRAMSSQPLRRRVSRQEIDLGIPLDACEPVHVERLVSRAATRIAGDDVKPLCFRVANVSFTFALELHDVEPDKTSSDA